MKIPVVCPECSHLAAFEPNPEKKEPCPVCGKMLEIPENYDVFISYASRDLDKAKQVAEALQSTGISYWLAPERIDLGESFAQAISGALESARIVVLVLSAASIKSPWVKREITDAVSNDHAVLPLRIEHFELPREWAILLSHNQWQDAFSGSFENYLPGLLRRIQDELRRSAVREAEDESGMASVAPVAPEELEGVNPRISPYVGPRPFPALMADKFFGREKESRELLEIIIRSRAVLVYAPSGAGKSSLLNTLIAESLETHGLQVYLGARVGGMLPSDARASEIRNIFAYSAIYALERSSPPDPQSSLTDFLHSVRRKPGTRGRVIIFDQFEELFTQHMERFEDRKEFLTDIIAALGADQSLRVVFAMRQEYLADLDPLVAQFPGEMAVRRFALQRLDPTAALDAIIKPAARYATFETGVAEKIVEQLNTIRVPGFDGVVVKKRGEFIEMVHLQIVCERLWRSLPNGITLIGREHVERAAGEGRTFNDFIVNALNAFYDDTIDQVVNSLQTREHGGYSKELIQLGCMKFVTTSATRTMVQQSKGRTGRLPDWIVDQLESSHLLRVEQRGGQHWYELSHDRLAEPVGRQMDRKVASLLYATDLLDKVLENAQQENNDTLQGYFVEHHDVLMECRPFHQQAGLFPDEAEFIFRSSLVAGQDMSEWCRRLGEDFPEVRSEVLNDALQSGSADVRKNTVALLGMEPEEVFGETLVRLALGDPDSKVRHEAATSLAKWDEKTLYQQLAAVLDQYELKIRVLEALAQILVASENTIAAPAFTAFYRSLESSVRRRIRRRARWQRINSALPIVPLIATPAAIFAAVVAPAFKWFPGLFNWALAQADPSAAQGVFQGVTAGIIWAGCITAGLTFFYLSCEKGLAPKSMFRPWGAILAGAFSGLLSSVILVLLVVSVFNMDALLGMGWILPKHTRFSIEFWNDLFLSTRFGWAYLITGTGLGIGMALMINALRASEEWTGFLRRQSGVRGLSHACSIIRDIMKIAVRKIGPMIFLMVLAAFASFWIPIRVDCINIPAKEPVPLCKSSDEGVMKGLVGDCATQTIGAYFAIVGMGLGIVVLRGGLRIEPRKT